MLEKMKKAGEYQKKAIYALLPEKMGKHLDVIENELKQMAAEAAAGLARRCMGKAAEENDHSQDTTAGTRKVNIK